jgi:curli biogenesis system outer membrane secretion channel CsgG
MRGLEIAFLLAPLLAPGLAIAQDGAEKTKPPENSPQPAAPPADPKPVDVKPQEAKPAPAKGKASLAVMKLSYVETVLRSEDGYTQRYMHELDTAILTNKFVTALVETHKFDVVDRDKLDQVLSEQQLGATGAMDPAKCVKAGKIVGADFFLTGAISYFVVTQQSIENPYAPGNWTNTTTAEIRVDVRLVDTRTTKILHAERAEARTSYRYQSNSNELTVKAQLIDDVERALCGSLAVRTADAIYPVKVAAFSDGVVFLNRGEGGGLNVGDVLDVIVEGEEITDPDTGASLGTKETNLGQIQVTAVEAKLTRAQPLGALTEVPKGALCRKAKTRAAAAPQAPAAPSPGPR